jgi:transcriptional repressor NrdR
MKCPYCKQDDDRVIETRATEAGVRRRRECSHCGRRFSSLEVVDKINITVIKRGGERQAFDRHKLETSIRIACRKRPIEPARIDDLVWKVEQKSLEDEGKEIHTRTLGELVIEELRQLDPVAFVRFSSVYRDYQDIDQFIDDIKKLKTGKKKR